MKPQAEPVRQFETATAVPALRRLDKWFTKAELEAMHGWAYTYNKHHGGTWQMRDLSIIPRVDGVVIQNAENTCKIEIFKFSRAYPLYQIFSPAGAFESTDFPQILIHLHQYLKELSPKSALSQGRYKPA